MGDDWFPQRSFSAIDRHTFYEPGTTARKNEQGWTSHYDDRSVHAAGSAGDSAQARVEQVGFWAEI